jgi:pilus assembly protein CpaB
MQTTFSQTVLEKPVIIVSVALALLAAAGGMMWTNIAAHEDAAVPVKMQAPALTTVTAAGDIARGQLLTAQDLSLKTVTQVPSGGLIRTDVVAGHMALADIKAGAPVLASQISTNATVGIATRVPEGFRAYAIPVSEADIAGGFVQTGDHVDLYVTLPGALFATKSEARQDDQSKSTLLLSSIAVLAVGTKLDTDGSANTSVRTVTLALNSADLAKVALASRLGTITFAIRNPAEHNNQAQTLADLGVLVGKDFDTKPEVGKPAPKPVKPGIPMLSGAARTTIHLP